MIGTPTNWQRPAIATVLLWGVWAFLPKAVGIDMGAGNYFVFYSVGVLLCLIFLVVRYGLPDYNRRGVIVSLLVGAVSGIGTLSYSIAVEEIAVAVASTAQVIHVPITLILARMFLGETMSRRQALGSILAMVAVVLFMTSK